MVSGFEDDRVVPKGKEAAHKGGRNDEASRKGPNLQFYRFSAHCSPQWLLCIQGEIELCDVRPESVEATIIGMVHPRRSCVYAPVS